MIFDSWRNNTPFEIDLETFSPQTITDVTPSLVMRQVIGRPIPQLPAGVSGDSVNLIEVSARVTE